MVCAYKRVFCPEPFLKNIPSLYKSAIRFNLSLFLLPTFNSLSLAMNFFLLVSGLISLAVIIVFNAS